MKIALAEQYATDRDMSTESPKLPPEIQKLIERNEEEAIPSDKSLRAVIRNYRLAAWTTFAGMFISFILWPHIYTLVLGIATAAFLELRHATETYRRECNQRRTIKHESTKQGIPAIQAEARPVASAIC